MLWPPEKGHNQFATRQIFLKILTLARYHTRDLGSKYKCKANNNRALFSRTDSKYGTAEQLKGELGSSLGQVEEHMPLEAQRGYLAKMDYIWPLGAK